MAVDEMNPLPVKEEQGEGIVINEIQLILAEKRTSLAVMRTGIAVFVLPLTVLSILIATSKYYDLHQVIPLLVPLFLLCAALVVLGTYLTHRAVQKIRKYDAMILELKKENEQIARFIR
ncbi:MAG: DUF202 domain-containing protein [Planctomycetota bacterium]|jgi:uncharacterized membrane protein YkgB